MNDNSTGYARAPFEEIQRSYAPLGSLDPWGSILGQSGRFEQYMSSRSNQEALTLRYCSLLVNVSGTGYLRAPIDEFK